jgi:hypothetical protein
MLPQIQDPCNPGQIRDNPAGISFWNEDIKAAYPEDRTYLLWMPSSQTSSFLTGHAMRMLLTYYQKGESNEKYK